MGAKAPFLSPGVFMAVDALAICNSALSKIGAAKIDALTDVNKRATLCNQQYSILRDELLRSHPWNFAIKRKYLSKEILTFVDGDVTVGTDLITSAAHNLENATPITISTTGVLPTGLSAGTYYVSSATTNTFKLSDTIAKSVAAVEDVIDITAAAGGGTHTLTINPNFGWNYKFVLPSDYLRAVRLEPKAQKFVIEDGKLLTDDSEVYLLYISDITDTTKFDPAFDELLALHIAHQICYDVVQSNSLKETIAAELRVKLKDVRSFDAQEGTPEEFEADTFINSRF
jgi:hypothetical protein